MSVKELVSVALAIGSVLLGGSLGTSALEKANAAPLSVSTHRFDRSAPSA